MSEPEDRSAAPAPNPDLQTIALHTRLKPGAAKAYASAHEHIPEQLVTALHDSGVHSWKIWRDGLDLFHVVVVEDYAQMRHTLAKLPVNIAWQKRMSTLLEIEDDYSGEDTGLELVWKLR